MPVPHGRATHTTVSLSRTKMTLLGALAGLLLLGGGATVKASQRVEAGEICVVKDYGDAVDKAGPGWNWNRPYGISYECYSTRSTMYEGVNHDPKQSDSKADYVDHAVEAVTFDGQAVKVTFAVKYKVDPDQVLDTHTNVARTMNILNENVVKFHTRTVVQNVVNKSTAAQLYSGGLETVNQEVTDQLLPLFDQSGVILEHFEIKRPYFDEEYTSAIEQKQLALETAEQRRNEVLVAEQEAEAARVRAQGLADADVIEAEGDAKAMALRGDAIDANPSVLTLEYYKALGTINWAIFSPEDVQPMLPVPPVEPTDQG